MIPQIDFLPRLLDGLGSRTARFAALCLGVFALQLAGLQTESLAQFQATIKVDFVEEGTGQPIPVRLELRDGRGRPQKVKGAVFRSPWTLLEEPLDFKSRTGSYQFDVFHGPQFAGAAGGFNLQKDGDGFDVVRLPRHATLESEGWFSGDLLSYVQPEETGRWLPADDLIMAATLAWPVDPKAAQEARPAAGDPDSADADDAASNAADNKAPVKDQGKPSGNAQAVAAAKPDVTKLKASRWLNTSSYIDLRAGGNLVVHGWQPPAAVPEWVPPCQLLEMAKKSNQAHAELSRLWSDDTPMLLATGKIDSVQILAEHTTRDGKSNHSIKQMFNPEPELYRGPRASGKLVERLYWDMLDAGLHIPPSAGSGFGKTTSPLGYNRIYAMCEPDKVSPEAWWQAVRSGKSFVTNGPLLCPTVNGLLPGHTFEFGEGEKFSINVGLVLTTSEPVEYVDVVFNGEALYHARLDEHAKRGGKIPKLDLNESGWLVVRVTSQREETYRMATSAPYYFQCGGTKRVRKSAAEMFLRWLEEGAAKLKADQPQRYKASQPYLESARAFWRERIERATVEE